MSMEELKQNVASRLDHMDVNEPNNSDDDEIDDDDWDEIEEDSNMAESIPCLFQYQSCEDTFSSLEKAILHLKHSHKLDFLELKLVHQMDCYLFIKLINYIRKHNSSPAEILKLVSENKGDTTKLPWSLDQYMKPHLTDDPWLMYDYDDIEESMDDPAPLNGVHHVNVEHGRITMTQEHYASLQDQIKVLTQQLQEKTVKLEMNNEDMAQMREVMQELLGKKEDEGESKSRRHDKYYFNSYEDAHIHAEMIKDTVRTESYKNAILNNRALFQNKHVIDVGAGTGILSTFAAQAGAAKVYAVEKSDIAYETMDIIRTNGYSSQIEVHHKLLEDIELPVDKVDIIISEWMGYFLLFETMVDSVIAARDRFLKPDGVVLPNRFSLHLTGAYDEGVHSDLIGFWSNVHGLNMSAMTRLVFPDVQILTISPASIVTPPVLLTQFDLNNRATTARCVNFATPFILESTSGEETRINCLVAYFDTSFDLEVGVRFSTSPSEKSTHWKQSVFLLKQAVTLSKGEKLAGSLTCERMENDSRSLNITITLGSTTQVFQLQ